MEVEFFNLNSNKAATFDSIPVKTLKLNDLACTNALTIIYNKYIAGYFPGDLKNADISPICKREDRHDKRNCRPVSILSAISKVFERLMYTELYAYFNTIRSNHICGFRKGFSAQHCLIVMLEKFRKTIYNNPRPQP